MTQEAQRRRGQGGGAGRQTVLERELVERLPRPAAQAPVAPPASLALAPVDEPPVPAAAPATEAAPAAGKVAIEVPRAAWNGIGYLRMTVEGKLTGEEARLVREIQAGVEAKGIKCATPFAALRYLLGQVAAATR